MTSAGSPVVAFAEICTLTSSARRPRSAFTSRRALACESVGRDDLRVAGPERQLDRGERHRHPAVLARRRGRRGDGRGGGDGARRVAADAQRQVARRHEAGAAQDAQRHLRAQRRGQRRELRRRRVADRDRRGAGRDRRRGERKLLHAVVVAVGDGEQAVAVDAHAADGWTNSPRAAPRCPKASSRSPSGPNSWMRLLPRSATHRLPAASSAICPGDSSLPSLLPWPPNSSTSLPDGSIDLDAVAGGGHVGALAVGRHRDPAPVADAGGGAQVAAAGAEARDALVARVGHDDGAAAVDGQRRGVEQLARAAAGRADRAHRQPGRAREDDDPRAPAIEDVGVAARVEGDGHGSGRIVGPGAGEPHDEAGEPSGLSSCDAAVDRVGHRADAAGVRRDAHRRVELPRRPARRAERAQERAALVEDVDAVVAGVGHVDVALAGSTAIPRG